MDQRNITLPLIWRKILPESCLYCHAGTFDRSHLCTNCRNHCSLQPGIAPLRGVLRYVPVHYSFLLNGPGKALLYSAKFHFRPGSLDFIRARIKLSLPSDAVVIPVPGNSGFAERLVPREQMLHVLFKEADQKGSMKLLSRKQRLSKISSGFYCTLTSSGLPDKVILFDDVMTTGTTLTNCLSLLYAAGVSPDRITIMVAGIRDWNDDPPALAGATQAEIPRF